MAKGTKENPRGTNVFGGEFTPFKDLWQTAAGKNGIRTTRMRLEGEGLIEREVAQLQASNMALAELMQAPGSTDEDRAQATQMMRDSARLTSQNISDIRNGRAPQNKMADPSSVVGGFYEDQEASRQATEANAAQQAYDLRLKRRDELRTDIQKTLIEPQRQIGQKFNTFTALLDKSDPSSPIVQKLFEDLLGSNPGAQNDAGDAQLRINIPGLGGITKRFGGEDERTYTRDEMIQMATAWRQGNLEILGQLTQAYQQRAMKDGWAVDTEDGTVNIEDLNLTDYSGEGMPEAVVNQFSRVPQIRGQRPEQGAPDYRSPIERTLATIPRNTPEDPTLWEGIRSFWDLELRPQDGESQDSYKARLAEIRTSSRAEREARQRAFEEATEATARKLRELARFGGTTGESR